VTTCSLQTIVATGPVTILDEAALDAIDAEASRRAMSEGVMTESEVMEGLGL
jgi:hypothetical protein